MTELLTVDPVSDPRWLQLVSGHGGSLFTSPPWLTALSGTYGFRPTARVLLAPSGEPVAGFAWADVDDLRGPRRIALPFSDRGDPVAADADAWAAVSADAFNEQTALRMRCLDTSPAAKDRRFVASGEAAWHETLLGRSPDDVWAALRPSTRRNIATAQRCGVRVELSDDIEAVVEYHRLHVLLRKRKYRLLAQPLEFFEHLHKAFGSARAIKTALAMVGNRPVAGAVYLVWGDTLYYKFGASLAEYLHLRPNDAIHWTTLNWAQDQGLRALDWGLSDLDQPGLVAYKRNWASREGRIRTLRAERLPPRRLAQVDETLGALTDLLTTPSVPDTVTERAGALLYRFFC